LSSQARTCVEGTRVSQPSSEVHRMLGYHQGSKESVHLRSELNYSPNLPNFCMYCTDVQALWKTPIHVLDCVICISQGCKFRNRTKLLGGCPTWIRGPVARVPDPDNEPQLSPSASVVSLKMKAEGCGFGGSLQEFETFRPMFSSQITCMPDSPVDKSHKLLLSHRCLTRI